VAAICDVVGADCAVLYPYHPSFGEFYDLQNVVACGLHHELQLEKKFDKRAGLTARIHRLGEVICEDTEQEEPRLSAETPFIALEEVKAFMGQSLRVGDTILGILYVDYRTPHHFSEEEKQVIRLFSQQAALAVSNAWTFRLAQDRANAITNLKAIGQTLLAIEDPSKTLDSLLDRITHAALEVLDADIVDLYQYIQTQDEVILPAIWAGKRLYPEIQKTRIYADDAVIKSIKTGTFQYCQDVQDTDYLTRSIDRHESERDQRFVIRERIASSASIPLITAGETVGVLFVNYRTPQFFNQEQRDVIETFAAQAAIAIENARLFEFMRRTSAERQRRLELLQEISARMAEAGLDPDEVLELVAQTANDLSHSDLTSIYRYDHESGQFTRGVRVLQSNELEQVDPNDLPDVVGLPLKIAQTQEPVFIEEVDKYPEVTAFARKYGILAFAGLPLTIVGPQGVQVTVGVLFVNFNQPHAFSESEQEILRHLANQAAVAIAYAGAQESAHAKEQLAALGTAAATLQHRLGNTINVILPAVMRLRFRTGDDPIHTDILDTIERNALLATEVIRRMQTPLRQEPFIRTNLNDLLREAIEKCVQERDRFPQVHLKTRPSDLTGLPLEAGGGQKPVITISANLADFLPETFANSGQLTEVFRVLVENGIKAIYPHAGVVTIFSQLEEDQLRPSIRVTVSDTGKGIDEKTQGRLFRQPVPRKEFGEGAGLGLWLSHIIIRSHQGILKLDSTIPGQGSTFLVRLPILSQPPPNKIIQRTDSDER
jgi:GAF domain-containing protein